MDKYFLFILDYHSINEKYLFASFYQPIKAKNLYLSDYQYYYHEDQKLVKTAVVAKFNDTVPTDVRGYWMSLTPTNCQA